MDEYESFKDILKLSNEDVVDYQGLISISILIHFYLLTKYKNKCIFIGPTGYLDRRTYEFIEENINSLLTTYEKCNDSHILCISISKHLTADSWHRNMLIINPILKKIELYEPHGNRFNERDNKFLQFIETYFREKGTKDKSKNIEIDYDFSINACPYLYNPYIKKGIGIQAYDGELDSNKKFIQYQNQNLKDPRGFCTMWSWLLMEFRLMYPDKTISEYSRLLQSTYLHNERYMWRKFIRGYTHGIIQELNKLINDFLTKNSEYARSNNILFGRDITYEQLSK